ncbi:hypothetical protein [Oceanobacillus iheyensis HTE831]|uniref:Uncharacterized protein n=1 Tax=Oceanobacillus iheyensis (strain DSM 14371 / CIP 107618 / JCM 11309 / KCTC 3954 / HTE831) TaxID=221109 RepID=Q8CUU0_OCEIH|nr:hypothetical protein [Oceanobacillus iheyensis]BAC12973.1 hypothetical protein [Oceanobacillus iheyensis HTE831]
MGKNQKKKGNKRFWWVLISVIIIVGVGSSIFFFNFFGIGLDAVNNSNTAGSVEQKDLSAEEEEKINTVRSTLGESHQELGAFVSTIHEFYNDTTGYGGISNLNWEEQRNTSERVINEIEGLLGDVTDESLRNDLESIITLSKQTMKEEDVELVRLLHRYFHDLDIALNDYATYDRIWNVTETLK